MSDDYRPTHSPRRNIGEFVLAVISISALMLSAVVAAVILVLGD